MSLPFRPSGATITAAGSTASTTEAQISGFEGPSPQIRIFNASAAVAYVKWGMTGVAAATAADYPIPPGGCEVVSVTAENAYVRVLLSTGTGNVHFTAGRGV